MNEVKKAKSVSTRGGGVGTGTTSLLMIFTVLCFATLAMLSLSTAASNDRIQSRGLDGGKNLSTAKGESAMEVAQLDEQLLDLKLAYASQGKTDEKAYMQEAYELAKNRGWQYNEDNNTLVWTQNMDSRNELLTQIQILSPAEDQRYTVIWQVSQIIGGWEPEGDRQMWIPEVVYN